jgi:hypothetical protein
MAAAALVAGTALTAYSQYRASQLEAEAGQQKAFVKRLQAREIMDAAERDAEISLERGRLVKSSQLSAFGRAGVDIEGSPLAQITSTMSTARKEAEAQIRAGKYRAFTSNYEADLQDYLGGETKKAGAIAAAGTILGGVGSYSRAKGNL